MAAGGMEKTADVLRTRFFKFGLVGTGVMFLGLGIMIVCVDLLHINKNLAYLVQTVVSVESNFFLNAVITWRDRTRQQLWKSWIKFHGLKITTMIISQFLFAGLLLAVSWIQIPALAVVQKFDYVIAYFACIGIITLINFIGNDKWVFQTRKTPNR